MRLGIGVTDTGRRNPEIVDQLADWRGHRLSYPGLLNLSTLQPSLRRGLAAGGEFAKVIRGPRKL